MFDYLIVGQGISGSLLSYFLTKNHKSVAIIDNPELSSSSKVAAGLINPITGQRMVKSWKVDELLPFALKTYQEIEDELFVRKDIYRLFSSVEDQNDSIAKTKNQDISSLIEDKQLANEFVNTYYGSVLIKNGGYLNINNLIAILKKNVDQIEADFNYNDLKISGNFIEWKEIKAKRIIFCEGYLAINNPYFNWLPFAPTKGELITIESDDLRLDSIITKGIFILPITNNRFKVGATFDWNNINENRTELGKEFLVEKLKTILSQNCSYKIVNHEVGIRPTVRDRRPFIGLHPELKQLGIFNGMGSKSVLLAPFMANQFAEYLENNIPLDKEVDILRYWEKAGR